MNKTLGLWILGSLWDPKVTAEALAMKFLISLVKKFFPSLSYSIQVHIQWWIADSDF